MRKAWGSRSCNEKSNGKIILSKNQETLVHRIFLEDIKGDIISGMKFQDTIYQRT
jgi:hypothetical protein